MLIGFHIWALKLGNQYETIIIGCTVSDVRSYPIFNFRKSDVKFGETPLKFNSSPLENDDWKIGRRCGFLKRARPIFRGELFNFQGVL